MLPLRSCKVAHEVPGILSALLGVLLAGGNIFPSGNRKKWWREAAIQKSDTRKLPALLPKNTVKSN